MLQQVTPTLSTHIQCYAGDAVPDDYAVYTGQSSFPKTVLSWRSAANEVPLEVPAALQYTVNKIKHLLMGNEGKGW